MSQDKLVESLPQLEEYKPKRPKLAGRQPGVKNKLTLLREAVLNKQEHTILEHLPKIVEVVCRKAEEGDLTAAKLILERVIPVKKMTDGDLGPKGPPMINIVIEGSEGLKGTTVRVETPQIVEGEFQESEENEDGE